MYLYSKKVGLINLEYIKTVDIMSIPDLQGDKYHVVVEREDDSKCYTLVSFDDKEKALAVIAGIANAMSIGERIYKIEE